VILIPGAKYMMFPLALEGRVLTLAMEDPTNSVPGDWSEGVNRFHQARI